MPRDHRILLLRVNALIEGNGPDDEKEARRVALKLTIGIADPRRAADLTEEMAAALSVVKLEAEMHGGMGAKEHARAVLAEIEAARERSIQP